MRQVVDVDVKKKIRYSKTVVPKLFEPGAGCRYFGPPRAKAREKKSSLRFDI